MDKSSPLFLFHQPKFIFRNPDASVMLFEHDSARIYFSRIGESLISLDRAPFGGFVLGSDLKKNDLLSCLEKILSWSRSHGATTVIIRSFPDAYHPECSALIAETLLTTSYNVLYRDITQVIDVMRGDVSKLGVHKKRRIRTAESKGFQFRPLSLDWLEKSYALIVQSRVHKDYPITMTLGMLQDTFSLFPDEYMLFGVFDNERLIAASVSIRVNPEILYCFYIGDDLDYRSCSPVTFLVNGIYDFCKVNRFRLLDIGLSTDKGTLNTGLYNFKKTFGAVDSYKLTFVRQT